MSDHVMLDLETVDNVPTAAILSIGAVVFKGPKVGRQFYVVVDSNSSIASGGTASEGTMKWWAAQSAEARKVFDDPDRMSIDDALAGFSSWVDMLDNPCVWGNGSDFDNAIMACSYSRLGMDLPWKFWNNRCYRTAVAGKARRVQTGTHHNALDDAISQADHLLKVAPEAVR